jgi:hypothetical protein
MLLGKFEEKFYLTNMFLSTAATARRQKNIQIRKNEKYVLQRVMKGNAMSEIILY